MRRCCMLLLVLLLCSCLHYPSLHGRCDGANILAKHKKKEIFPFLVLAFMPVIKLALPWFTRWFLVLMVELILMLASYV